MSASSGTLVGSEDVSLWKQIVRIGPECIPFVLDMELVNLFSPTLQQLLEENKYQNPNIRPKVFGMFLVWLHYKNEFSLSLSDDVNDWFDLYVFAARNDMMQLQNDSLDTLQDLYLRRNTFEIPQSLMETAFDDLNRTIMRCLRQWCVAMALRELKEANHANIILLQYLRFSGFVEELIEILRSASQIETYLFEDPRRRAVQGLSGEFVSLEIGFPRCFFHRHGLETNCDSTEH